MQCLIGCAGTPSVRRFAADAFPIGRELERRGSRAAAELEDHVAAFQIMPRAVERPLVARDVGDRVGGVFARDAIPEARERFGEDDDAAHDEALPALVLACEHEDGVAVGDMLAAIHRLLRRERDTSLGRACPPRSDANIWQLAAAGGVVEIPSADGRRIKSLASPVRFNTNEEEREPAAPAIGEHARGDDVMIGGAGDNHFGFERSERRDVLFDEHVNNWEDMWVAGAWSRRSGRKDDPTSGSFSTDLYKPLTSETGPLILAQVRRAKRGGAYGRRSCSAPVILRLAC